MDKVQGQNIDVFPFENLKLVSELLCFEHDPILIHYVDSENSDIISYWVDWDVNCRRWLFVKITKDELRQYLNGDISFRELLSFKDSEQAFIFDQNGDGDFIDGVIINPQNIPPEYLPDKDAYFGYGLPDGYEDYFKASSITPFTPSA